MATKITVALEDDLDGGPAGETRRFAVRGTAYEIDLNKKNARALASNWRPSSSAPQGRPAADERDHAQPGCVAIQVVCQVCGYDKAILVGNGHTSAIRYGSEPGS